MLLSKSNKKKFLFQYFTEFKALINSNDKTLNNLIKLSELMLKTHKNKKIMIAGNGGSAAVSSHFSVDLTKNAKVRSLTLTKQI